MSNTIEIVPGKYRSIKPLRFIKELTHSDKKNADGTIARTFGTWSKSNNFYYFSDKTSTTLTEKDLEHPSIRKCIEDGTIYRVLS